MGSNWGIKTRVIILAIIPALLVSLLLGGFFISDRYEEIISTRIEHSRTLSTYLAQAAELATLSGDRESLTRLANSARNSETDITAVAIYDAAGQILAEDGQFDALQALHKFITDEQNRQTRFLLENASIKTLAPIIMQSSGTPEYSISAANAPRLLGWVALQVDNNAIKVQQYQAMVTGVLIILAALGVSVLLAEQMSRSITNPIIQLANAIKRIKEGQLKVTINTPASGELKTLVEGFNSMSQAIYEAREEMQQRVEQATSDLHQTNLALEEQNVELDMARKAALEASKVKSEFLANMSHEIRTPMNGVLGFTNILLKTNLTPKQRDHLLTIQKSASQLLSLIDNVLDFSKIEAGKMELEHRPISIHDCLDEVLTLLGPAAMNKNIELIGIVYDDVPDALLGDHVRISQILTNLCNNAIKFTPQGHIQVRVMLEDETPQSARLKITVTDTGIGLSEQQQKILFKAFSQADTTTTRRFGGTGLGLVICKKLVEAMKGQIGLESKENVGSTFWFTLELDKDHDARPVEDFAFPGHRVLLHDKNGFAQLATQYLLKRWEVEVLSCDSMVEMRDLLQMIYEQGKSLDMVILGGYLPDEHPELWQQIHQLSEQLDSSNLVLLNTNDAEQQQALRKLGYKHLLEKPVTRKKLYDALFDGLSVKQNIVSSQSKNIQSNLNRKLRILCVDDNPSNLKLIDAFLNEYPVETTLASSGHEAIASCRKNDFDLIFMDIQMPDMDGVETTAEIRKLKPGRKLPVVAITAHALKGEKEKLLASGLDDYLTKPIDQLQLEAILSKWAGIEFTTDTPPKLKNTETDELTEKTQNTEKSDNSLCIDWTLSLKKAGGKDDLAVDMLRMLVASFDDTVQSIDSAFKNNDRQLLLAQVHKLHGATAYCGVPRLKQIAHDYETELKNDSDLIDLQPLHLSLLSEIKMVTQEAQKILAST